MALKASRAVRNKKLARAALGWNMLPNFFAITMDDPAGDTPLRRMMALPLMALAIWYLVNELFFVGTQTIESISIPSRLLYDLQFPPSGGSLKAAVDGLWSVSMPEDAASWNGANNRLPEVPLELTLYGSSAARALVRQVFSPYSRCTEHVLASPPTFEGIPNFEAEIDTSVASGQSILRYREGGAAWQTAPFTSSVARQLDPSSCAECDAEPSSACENCWVRLRVKLCGNSMPGNDLTTGTYVSVRLPIEDSNATLRVGLRPTRSGCFGSGVCSDPMSEESSSDPARGTVAVAPYGRLLLMSELRLNLESNWAGDMGAYGLSPRGSLPLGESSRGGPNHACDTDSPGPDVQCGGQVAFAGGSELRLTLGDVVMTRKVDRFLEIAGLIGGFFGTAALVLGMLIDLIERVTSAKKKSAGAVSEVDGKVEKGAAKGEAKGAPV